MSAPGVELEAVQVDGEAVLTEVQTMLVRRVLAEHAAIVQRANADRDKALAVVLKEHGATPDMPRSVVYAEQRGEVLALGWRTTKKEGA